MAKRAALVTGGSGGIGLAIARRLAQSGYALTISGRREDKLLATAEALANEDFKVEAVVADVTSEEAVVDLVAEHRRQWGRLDCLVNNAGVGIGQSIDAVQAKHFDLQVAVNLRAPFFTMQAAVQDMLGRQSPGSIVNILSTSMHVGQTILAAYVASKGGLAHVTKNAAHAHRFDRIRINGLNIGWTITEGEDAIQRRAHGATDGWYEKAAAGMPMGKLGQPDEIADFIVFLLSERSGVVTGSIIDWDQNVIGALD